MDWNGSCRLEKGNLDHSFSIPGWEYQNLCITVQFPGQLSLKSFHYCIFSVSLQVVWKKDSQPLSSGTRTQAKGSKDVHSTEHLLHLTATEYGNYSCIATNRLGEDTAAIMVTGELSTACESSYSGMWLHLMRLHTTSQEPRTSQ